MTDSILEDKEIDRLADIGEPQGGDDDQMVAFRTMARVMLKVAKSQRDMSKRLQAVKDATGTCEETHTMVKGLVSALAPPDKPEEHITVRVSALEKLLSGWRGTVAKVALPVVIAVVLGALGLAWNATVEAAAAKKHASAAIEATGKAGR